jgi:hypothetical protein
MNDDPIVAEVRKARHEHAAKFNYDIAAIFEDTRRQEKESGRQYVSYPPRRIEPLAEGKAPAKVSKRSPKRKRKAKQAKK